MSFDMMNPFSGLHGEVNGATAMLLQRTEDKENAIRYLRDLVKDDVDITDPLVIKKVLRFYGLEDISKREISEMIKEASV